MDEVVEALKEEHSRPEAKARARMAMAPRSGRRHFTWRWAAVAGLAAIVTVPIFFRRGASVTYAATFQQAVNESAKAINVHTTSQWIKDGKVVSTMDRWSSRGRTAFSYESNDFPFADMRLNQEVSYIRYRAPKPYECIAPAAEPDVLQSISLDDKFSVFDNILKDSGSKRHRIQLLATDTATLNGKKVKRYKVRHTFYEKSSSHTLYYVNPDTSRIIRTEGFDTKGKLYSIGTYEYPETVDDALFAPPPPIEGVPRFYEKEERQAAVDSAKAAETLTLAGKTVKCLFVIQDPMKQIWVVWKGVNPGTNTKFPVKVGSFAPLKGGYKFTKDSVSTAAVGFKAIGEQSSVDVQLPVFSGSQKFLGYVTAKNVPVRQSLPVHYFNATFRDPKARG